MTPETRAKVVFGLDTASNDPRISEPVRREAERQLRNQRKLIAGLATNGKEIE